MFDLEHNKNKMRDTDRKLVLRPIEGKATKSNIGMVDNRLFTGDNTLHAVQDPQTTLWTLNYDSGAVPGALKQKFTSFSALMKYVTQYFLKRNIEIIEVID